MARLELEIPELLLRKIKALSTLSGEGDIEEVVVSLMDKSVSLQIADLLGLLDHEVEPQEKKLEYTKPVARSVSDEVADGLGDDEEESYPPPVDDMYALIPKGGMSDKLLDRDMDVDDPEHEAKAEAVDLPSSYNHAEDIFSQMVGLPLLDTQTEHEIDPRVARRKRKLNIRGKVSAATSIQESF